MLADPFYSVHTACTPIDSSADHRGSPHFLAPYGSIHRNPQMEVTRNLNKFKSSVSQNR